MDVADSWDEDSYGPIAAYGVDPDVTERDELHLGDYVVALENYETICEGDEGTIVGFTKDIPPGQFGGGHGERVLVKWDGMDPSAIDAGLLDLSD